MDLDYEKKIGLEFARWWQVLEKELRRKVDLVPFDTAYPKILKSAEQDKILMYQMHN